MSDYRNKTVYIPFRVKAEDGDAEKGIVSGMASTNDIDLVGDIIEAGAFDASIKAKADAGGFFPLLSEHDAPVGKILETTAKKDGLFIKAQLFVEQGHNLAKDTFINVKEGVQDSFSVGFRIKEAGFEVRNEENVFVITEADLKEVSIVANPANPQATIQSVKSLIKGEEKTHEQSWLDEFDRKMKVRDSQAEKEKFWEAVHKAATQQKSDK